MPSSSRENFNSNQKLPADREDICQYTDWEHIDDGYLNQKMIGDVVGDFFFVCPCNYFAMQYAEHGNKVYYYYFNHVSLCM